MAILSLALKSLLNRKGTAALTIFAIGLSVALLIGVEKVRTQAKASFANTIAGTDLIVGARSGPIPLLLYSVFRIGNATSDISWRSYQRIARDKRVAWTIPISLGDSHRGFRVVGTNQDYFRHYRYGPKRRLAFAAGGPFADLFDAVLGADVAAELGYTLGQKIVISHGVGQAGFSKHEDKPFRVAGILKRTGTPVDRAVHVTLEAIEAIHIDWRGGSRVPGMSLTAEEVRRMDLKPKRVTAFLVGLKSRFAAFALQRQINTGRGEPMLAILPGVALHELWALMGTAEAALSAISMFVVATGLLGMLTMLLAGINERRREMAILRSVGARPHHVFGLLLIESGVLTMLGAIVGLTVMYLAIAVAQPVVNARYGLYLPIAPPTAWDGAIIAVVIACGILSGAIPAYRAYRQSLADGLIARI